MVASRQVEVPRGLETFVVLRVATVCIVVMSSGCVATAPTALPQPAEGALPHATYVAFACPDPETPCTESLGQGYSEVDLLLTATGRLAATAIRSAPELRPDGVRTHAAVLLEQDDDGAWSETHVSQVGSYPMLGTPAPTYRQTSTTPVMTDAGDVLLLVGTSSVDGGDRASEDGEWRIGGVWGPAMHLPGDGAADGVVMTSRGRSVYVGVDVRVVDAVQESPGGPWAEMTLRGPGRDELPCDRFSDVALMPDGEFVLSCVLVRVETAAAGTTNRLAGFAVGALDTNGTVQERARMELDDCFDADIEPLDDHRVVAIAYCGDVQRGWIVDLVAGLATPLAAMPADLIAAPGTTIRMGRMSGIGDGMLHCIVWTQHPGTDVVSTSDTTSYLAWGPETSQVLMLAPLFVLTAASQLNAASPNEVDVRAAGDHAAILIPGQSLDLIRVNVTHDAPWPSPQP